MSFLFCLLHFVEEIVLFLCYAMRIGIGHNQFLFLGSRFLTKIYYG